MTDDELRTIYERGNGYMSVSIEGLRAVFEIGSVEDSTNRTAQACSHEYLDSVIVCAECGARID